MNLIQIQENLKDLPTQVIMSYANGQNPEVPPYMALGELNRRKMSEQRKAEPPTQSVKEKLESEAVGTPQGMPQGPQGIAQLPGAQMPQGMPQGAPQAMPQAAPGMAGGGLAELPVRDDMFNYAPGGIVAFAEGELVRGPGGELISDNDRAGEAEARAGVAASDQSQGPPISAIPPSGLASLEAQAAEALGRAVRGDTDEPLPKNKNDIRQEILDKNPELANLVNKIPGSELAALAAKLRAQNEASKAQFQEGQGRMGLAGLANALIAAGEATRGHKGLGFGEAMGGFGKSYGKFTEEDVKRQQAQQALERQQEVEVGKLDADIETLRQGYAKAKIEGRTEDAAAFEKALADRVARRQSLQVSSSKEVLSQLLEKQKADTLSKHYKAQEGQSAAQLEELKRQHEAQRNNWAKEASNRAEQLQIMRETRQTVEDKAIGKINQTIPLRVKSLEQRQKDLEFGGEEWTQIQNRIDDLYDQAYQSYGLKPPPRLPMPKVPVVQEKPGFFSGLFGGSPKTVSFDQLPK
jgi:hypothetical protein